MMMSVLVAAVLGVGGPAGATRTTSPAAWPQSGFDAGGSNFNPSETAITTANVASLTQAWRVRGRNFVTADGMLFVARPNKVAAYSIAACATAVGRCTPTWVANRSNDELAFSKGVLYSTFADNSGHDGIAAYDASGTTNCGGTPKHCSPLWMWTDRSAGAFVGFPKIGDGLLWVVDTVSENMSVASAHLRAFDIAHGTGCVETLCTPVRSIAAPLKGFSYTLGSDQVVIAGQPGHVTVYDAGTGAIEWRSAKHGYEGTVVAAGGTIYVANQQNLEIEAYPTVAGASCTGTPKVCTPSFVVPFAPNNPPTLAVTASRLFVNDHTDVRAYDAAGVTNCFGAVPTCQPLTTYPGAGGAVASIVAGGVLYSANQTSIDAYDATGTSSCDPSTHSCSSLWITTPEPIGNTIEVAGGLLITTSQVDGYVHVYALSS